MGKNDFEDSDGRKGIRLLDNLLINKIAAGEVVERPMSVVKELVENSIDAGASMISVEIANGGIDLIRVTDNGTGIPASEMRTAFLRHATSKLELDSDLDCILTLGFRGEALPSIASVSRMEMISRHISGIIGRRIEVEGGEIISEQDIGAVPGTTIVVRNLFYNVPARFKFLKKPAVEGGYISDLVSKLALGNPGIAFRYINNDSISLQTKGNRELKTVMALVYGKEVSGKLLEIEGKSDDGLVRVFGYVGKPEIARANRSYGTFFVNGRYVKSTQIQSAVEEAYKTRLMNGKFPVFVINIEIDPGAVDANVHPAKTEVRFSDEIMVYDLVRDSVIQGLKDNLLIPEVKLTRDTSFADEMRKKGGYSVYESNKDKEQLIRPTGEVVEPLIDVKQKSFDTEKAKSFAELKHKSSDTEKARTYAELKHKSPDIEKAESKPVKGIEVAEKITDCEEDKALAEVIPDAPETILYVSEAQEVGKGYIKADEQMFIEEYKIIGSVFGTYIMIEQNDSLLIIDQHAAHERILYERILAKMSGPIAGQNLLTPMVVRVNQNEKRIALENIEIFMVMGFEIEEFGEEYISIRTLPFIFGGPVKPDFFLDILDELEKPGKKDGVLHGKREIIAQAACKAAVKAGDRLSNEEIKEIIDNIMCMENPYSCPHGRPTVIELSRRELEKRFKRVT